MAADMVGGDDPTRISILGKDDIMIDFDIWRTHVVHDLLTNLKSSTYVLITDTNLSTTYVSQFTESFQKIASNETSVPRLLTYSSPPGETS